MKQIVLASASPRRKELLEQLGLSFEIMPSEKEEIVTTTLPADVVIELSKQKAKDIWGQLEKRQEDILVIGADTIVALEGEILGKPKDFQDAQDMLAKLSGKEHQVYTGVTMLWITADGKQEEYSFYVCTGVAMYRIGRAEIMDYVFGGEPMDKAGAYAIQGQGAKFIKSVRGEYSNVVGLPIGRLYQEMKAWDLL